MTAQRQLSSSTMTSSASLKRKRSGCVPTSVEGVVKRACTGKKSVQFNEELAVRSTANYLNECSSAEEEEQLRSKLWYQSEDFSSFLGDRNQTIRIWRAVGGNNSLIEPNYCVRGLETFSEMLVNNEFQIRRRQHVYAVLKEQKESNNNDERIGQASRNCTHWAIERALRLARQDALEANAIQRKEEQQEPEFSSSTLFKAPSMTPSFSLRQMLPQSQLSSASAASRETLMKMGFSNSMMPSRSVDVSQLKMMNMQFLRNLNTTTTTTQQRPCSAAAMPMSRGGNTSSTLDLLNEALRATSEL